MAGKRPNPSHLQVVDKAHAHRHAGYEQPEPSKDWPVAPDYLDDDEKLIFDNLVETISELYTPSASHTEMIALYAQNRALAKHLDYQLKHIHCATSYSIIDKAGNVIYKSYPEFIQLQNIRKECSNILKEFGLSPSSQRCVKIEKPKVKKNSFADLDEVNG